MTNHVPSLTTCQKLREAGFRQETLFMWSQFLSWDVEEVV